MQQSNVIFGALLAAFIVYITTKGELPTYISLLRGGAGKTDAVTSAAGAADSLLKPLASLPAIGTNFNQALSGGAQASGTGDFLHDLGV